MFKDIARHSHELLSVITLMFGTSHRDRIQTGSTIQSDVSVTGWLYHYRSYCGVAISQSQDSFIMLGMLDSGVLVIKCGGWGERAT